MKTTTFTQSGKSAYKMGKNSSDIVNHVFKKANGAVALKFVEASAEPAFHSLVSRTLRTLKPLWGLTMASWLIFNHLV